MQQKIALLRKFAAAVSLLTIIRCGKETSCGKDEWRGAQIFFPVVGLGFGFVFATIYGFLIKVFPVSVVIVGVLAGAVAITGARNEQGLARVADAMQRGTRESRREKLKRSSLGTAGTITMMLALLLKFALLSDLSPRQCWWALFVGPISGYWMMVALRQITEYVGNGNGLGTPTPGRGRLERKQFAGMTIGCALLTLPLGVEPGAGICLMTFPILFATQYLLKGLFGGLTIEAARAAVLVGELTVYLAAVMFR